jgi:hypothetical protein
MPRDGRSGKRVDSAVQIASKVRRAAAAVCPKCGRKSAIVRDRDDFYFYEVCRWRDQGLCDYAKVTER